MKIGILSDTHDNLKTLQTALEAFRSAGISTLIHCGDLISPEMAAYLNGFTVHYVNGNIDPSPDGVAEAIRALHPQNSAGEIFTGEIGGTSIAVVHGNLEGQVEQLAHSGKYAYVFHGHTHRRRDDRIGKARVINPGALGGLHPEARSIAILDLTSGALECIIVKEEA